MIYSRHKNTFYVCTEICQLLTFYKKITNVKAAHRKQKRSRVKRESYSTQRSILLEEPSCTGCSKKYHNIRNQTFIFLFIINVGLTTEGWKGRRIPN